ncbi:MAG TPA: O-antigen ligase family protein [Salinivirga sp.]|uniref:O-antigen ligase family protein n=1 Tax=Salinivirga sp. TaxID=1970192 RepID=UPI002B482F85|nr:O-antigen ligase family protein [Salinivirga sp.]HKK60042.1 O-antigen ligase family protein [Salinivirga sp.]
MQTAVQKYFTRENIHIFGIIVLLVGMPLSRSFMTIGQFILLANWLYDKNILNKFKKAFSNKLVLSFLGIIIIHFIGLIYTENFDYAARDLRVKLPLLSLPLIFATTKPLSKDQWRLVFKVFGIAILAASFISTAILISKGMAGYHTVRGISFAVSHIRFALMINLVIFVFIYMAVFPEKNDRFFRYWAIPSVLWLIVFMALLRSLTGFVVLGVGLFGMSLYYTHLINHQVFRFIVYSIIIGLSLIVLSFVVHSWARYNYRIVPKADELPAKTINGNKYKHHLNRTLYENSHFVYAYVSEKELRKEWNKRSKFKYDGKDKIGHKIKHVLIRYLASKGYTKDSVGVSKLTDSDVQAIENGVANYLYAEKINLYANLYRIFWELERYEEGKNPSGHSIIQRIYYLEAGWNIFNANPIFGVGTGDVQDAFDQYYEETNSKLIHKRRLRAHNQFLTIMLTFGVVGFVVFMWALFYPAFYAGLRKKLNLPMLIYLVIVILSMLNEDTIETQAGALFFTFFYVFFLWGIKERPIPGRQTALQFFQESNN